MAKLIWIASDPILETQGNHLRGGLGPVFMDQIPNRNVPDPSTETVWNVLAFLVIDRWSDPLRSRSPRK